MRREWGVKEGKESDIYKNWWKEIKNVLIHFSSSLQFDKTCMILFLLLLLHDINSVVREREEKEKERAKTNEFKRKCFVEKEFEGTVVATECMASSPSTPKPLVQISGIEQRG